MKLAVDIVDSYFSERKKFFFFLPTLKALGHGRAHLVIMVLVSPGSYERGVM